LGNICVTDLAGSQSMFSTTSKLIRKLAWGSLSFPYHLTEDRFGRIAVANNGESEISIVTSEGEFISSFF